MASVIQVGARLGKLRYLHCALCNTRWYAVRARCTACDSDGKVHYQQLEGGPAGVHAETCDACHSYLKILFLEQDPALDPVADDLASLAPVAAPEPVQIDAAAIAKALGAVQVAAVASPAAPARYALQGVLAGRDSGGGAAVIAVGDQPAKPFKVGAKVEDGLLLQSLSAREAHLGPQMNGPATMTLRLPLPDKR